MSRPTAASQTSDPASMTTAFDLCPPDCTRHAVTPSGIDCGPQLSEYDHQIAEQHIPRHGGGDGGQSKSRTSTYGTPGKQRSALSCRHAVLLSGNTEAGPFAVNKKLQWSHGGTDSPANDSTPSLSGASCSGTELQMLPVQCMYDHSSKTANQVHHGEANVEQRTGFADGRAACSQQEYSTDEEIDQGGTTSSEPESKATYFRHSLSRGSRVSNCSTVQLKPSTKLSRNTTVPEWEKSRRSMAASKTVESRTAAGLSRRALLCRSSVSPMATRDFVQRHKGYRLSTARRRHKDVQGYPSTFGIVTGSMRSESSQNEHGVREGDSIAHPPRKKATASLDLDGFISGSSNTGRQYVGDTDSQAIRKTMFFDPGDSASSNTPSKGIVSPAGLAIMEKTSEPVWKELAHVHCSVYLLLLCVILMGVSLHNGKVKALGTVGRPGYALRAMDGESPILQQQSFVRREKVYYEPPGSDAVEEMKWIVREVDVPEEFTMHLIEQDRANSRSRTTPTLFVAEHILDSNLERLPLTFMVPPGDAIVPKDNSSLFASWSMHFALEGEGSSTCDLRTITTEENVGNETVDESATSDAARSRVMPINDLNRLLEDKAVQNVPKPSGIGIDSFDTKDSRLHPGQLSVLVCEPMSFTAAWAAVVRSWRGNSVWNTVAWMHGKDLGVPYETLVEVPLTAFRLNEELKTEGLARWAFLEQDVIRVAIRIDVCCNRNPGRCSALRMLQLSAATGGWVSPCYPGRYLSNLVTWRFYVMIFVLWCLHSLASPAPVTLVHIPRLLFYLAVSLYRYFILYILLNFLEASVFRFRFDFSDHIVIYVMCLLMLTVELVAAGRSENQLVAAQYVTKREVSKSSERRDFVWMCCIKLCRFVSVLLCLQILYVCFFTATFFHSVGESIVGFIIGVTMLPGVFWLLFYNACFSFERMGILKRRHYS